MFELLGFAEANIITVYVLAVLIISVVTVNRIYSLIASVVSVLIFNFLFTYPKFTLHAVSDKYLLCLSPAVIIGLFQTTPSSETPTVRIVSRCPSASFKRSRQKCRRKTEKVLYRIRRINY